MRTAGIFSAWEDAASVVTERWMNAVEGAVTGLRPNWEAHRARTALENIFGQRKEQPARGIKINDEK